MSGKEELLSQEELGFLLTDYDTRGDERRDPSNDPWSAEDTDAVTLRGDLIDTSFQEVLQSIADDEGVLRLINPMEEHYLHVRSGSVQDLVVKRHVGRRVGQRLIAAGHLAENQLEEALRIHKRDGHPLGKVLVSQGFAKGDHVSRQIEEQSVEDFYSLFTWSVGQFEYRPGPPAPEHRESFAELPQFDIERVVAEVAQRREEWDRILCSPDGLESVVKPLRAAVVRLPAPHATILRNLNGEQSLRELAETTMLGLFECARAVKDLYDWKMVESAEPAQLLTIARSRLVSGEPKRAAMILQSLWTRLDPGDHEFAVELADALQRCGENRIAARCLLRTAEHCDLAQEGLELARKAHKADPRSLEVLTFLRDRLLDSGADDKETADVACALTDALAREEKFEEALEVITPFAKPRHESVIPFGRKVRLLCRLGSPQEAVAQLLELAEHYKEQGDRHREAGVYEHILRIDGDRADLVGRIRSLRPKSRVRVVTGVRVAVLAVALAIGGLVWVNHQSGVKLRDLTTKVSALLDSGNVEGARAELDADQDFLGHPVTDTLRDRLRNIQLQRATEEGKRKSEMIAATNQAAGHLKSGELEQALSIYGELLARKDQRNDVLSKARLRFQDLTTRLADVVSVGEFGLPAEPDPLKDEKWLRACLEQLGKVFDPGLLAEAEGLLQAQRHPVLLDCLGEEKVEQLVELATESARFLRLGEERKQQCRVRLTERIQKSHLAPLAESAERYAEKHQFREALEAYEKLIADYPDKNDPNMLEFEAERQRCEDIVQLLDSLDEATSAGDASLAGVLLKYLEGRWKKVPWSELVELPLWVESIPVGAEVSVNGRVQGATREKLLTRYHPSEKPHIRVSLDGFKTMERTLDEVKPLVRVFLPKNPNWEHLLPGTSTSRARAQLKSALLFVADRSGAVTALDPNGAKQWQVATGDLNGWLPTPLLFDGKIVISSRDGVIRCWDSSTARSLWESAGAPCEGAPVFVAGKIFAGTVDSRVVVLDPASGVKVSTTALPGSVRVDLAASDDQVFVSTQNGWLLCLTPSGQIVWKKRVGVTSVSAPCVMEGVVVGVTIDGHVMALDRKTGDTVWERFGIGEVAFAPERVGEFVYVASEGELISFRASDGVRGPRAGQTALWSTPPVVVGDRLLVGDRTGTVSVFETEKLDLLFTIKGKARVTSISQTPLGIVVAFEDKTIQFFERL